QDKLASILGCVAHRPGGTGTEHIAQAIGYLDLAVSAQEAAVLFGLSVQHHGVVRRRLVQGDSHAGAVFLQVLGDFHSFIVRIDRGARSPGSPVTASSTRAGALNVFRALALHENSWLVLRDGNASQQKQYE